MTERADTSESWPFFPDSVHPDGGQPITLDRIRRAYLTAEIGADGALKPGVIRLRPTGGYDDEWVWSFAQFKLRVGAALLSTDRPT